MPRHVGDIAASWELHQPSAKESDKEEEKEEDVGYPKVNATLVMFADIESFLPRESYFSLDNR